MKSDKRYADLTRRQWKIRLEEDKSKDAFNRSRNRKHRRTIKKLKEHEVDK